MLEYILKGISRN